MKVLNLLLIFALLFITIHSIEISPANHDFSSYASVKEITALSSTSYGKSLIETINLTLKSNGNIDKVKKLLEDLLFELTRDQSKADTKYGLEDARLEEKLKKLAKAIGKLTLKILGLKNKAEDLEKLIEKVKKNLKQYNKQLLQNVKQKTQLISLREKDSEDSKKSMNEHMDIINAIDKVVKQLEKLIGSISGKGKPKELKEIAAEKRDRLHKSFVEITHNDEEAAMFVQMATEADQKALSRLISILKKLRASAESSYNNDQAAESKSKRTFKNLSSIIDADVKKLNNMITQQNRNLKKYEKNLRSINNTIESEKRLRKNKQTEHKLTKKERAEKTEIYHKEKAQRESEMEIVRKLLKIVKTRLSNMSKYLKDSTES